MGFCTGGRFCRACCAGVTSGRVLAASVCVEVITFSLVFVIFFGVIGVKDRHNFIHSSLLQSKAVSVSYENRKLTCLLFFLLYYLPAVILCKSDGFC